MTVLHSTLTANHIPYAFTYANAAARLAATGFVSGDVGKLALETDGSLWMLMATTPVWGFVGLIPTPPVKGNFTIVNTPSGCVSADVSTGLALICPANGLTLYAFQDSVAAGGTFTLTAGFNASMPSGNSGAGLYASDASGKVVSFGVDCSAANFANGDYWTSFTSFSSNPISVDSTARAVFVQFNYDGTNFNFSSGNDINALVAQAPVSATAFLGTPTHVGLYGFGHTSPVTVTFFHYKHV